MGFETIPVRSLRKYYSQKDTILIDVRSREEYDKGHIPGAVNIPYDEEVDWWKKVPKNKTVILYCERGGTSLPLGRQLYKEGIDVVNIHGGYLAYLNTERQ